MITAAILTHNNEKEIERCIKSLKFCDEILIFDDNSTDRTVEIAKQYSVRVIQQSLDDDFALQRNRLMEQAKENWILFIDSDEQVTTELSDEIKTILKEPKYEVYYIKRQDYFWGKPILYGEVSSAREKGFIRLVKKGSGMWKGAVHERFETNKQAGELHQMLLHYPHETVSDFIEDINYYSTIRSKELLKKGHKASIIELLFLPFAKFFYTFFLKQGYKDGASGFTYSFLMSFHSFLVRAKLYQYQHISK